MLDRGVESANPSTCPWSQVRFEMPDPATISVLALESAAGACSAALYTNGGIIARRWEAMARGHAEALVPMAAAVMDGCGYDSLDAVAVTVGPGAYTGLRIGLSAARGIALAAGLPIVGITSFAAVAHGVAPENRTGSPMIVALETKRDDIYVQILDADLQPQSEPACLMPEEIAAALGQYLDSGPLLVAGDAARRVQAVLPEDARLAPGDGLADAAIVAGLAVTQLTTGGSDATGLPPRPLYLRPPDATPPAADRHRLR